MPTALIADGTSPVPQSFRPSSRSSPIDRSDMPTPGPKNRKMRIRIKSTCGKYPWDIAKGFEPLTWDINLLEDLRALVNLARGTVTIKQVCGELQRLASLPEPAGRVDKLMRVDVVATKTWVTEKIERAIAGSPEPSGKNEDEDGNCSPVRDTVTDQTVSGDKFRTSPLGPEVEPIVGGEDELDEGHEERSIGPNGQAGEKQPGGDDDEAFNPETPVRPVGRRGTPKSMEKQASSSTSMTRKRSVPATSPSAAKRQKTVNGTVTLNKLQPGSGFQTTPEDEQARIMDSFTDWLGKKTTEDGFGARGQQVIEQALKQSAEARLKAIKEDQTKEAAALSQLLSLQQSHSGVIGDELMMVIQRMEARVKASQEDLDKAQKDTATRAQSLEKLSESIKMADSNAARLKQESEHLSWDVEEMKKRANMFSTVNMFFNFGLNHVIEALEEDFGDMKDWIEQKIAAEGLDVRGAT
ncbi:hypothetical protein BHE90_007569 [Fusarium euwallaceae]|uniref:Uncharacterized protein n=1 Tax=Fusarium euwallaceae TaxID=1147111 RepID=A0A430LQK2_9HYPO|nr:hypothetical protein BHE90_007569 [Fusarium euwallaceae]